LPTKLEGGEALRKALKGFTTDLSSFIYQEMDTLFAPIVKSARGFIPSTIDLSGWQEGTQKGRWEYRAWDRNEAVAGIGYSVKPSKPNRSGFVSLARIVNASAAGAIYETAGRKNPGGRPQISTITKKKSYYEYSYTRSGTNKESSSNNPFAGAQFIDALNEQGLIVDANNQVGRGRRSRKYKGRAIFRAWKQDGGKTNGAVVKAIESSKREFYAQLGTR